MWNFFLRIIFISINDIKIIFGNANYSNYYITIDAMLQEYRIFNDDGIVVNRWSTKNDMKITKYEKI